MADPPFVEMIYVSAARQPFTFTEPTKATLDLPGFNDFFRAGFARAAFTPSDVDKVRDLAHQFRLGRWRQHVRAL